MPQRKSPHPPLMESQCDRCQMLVTLRHVDWMPTVQQLDFDGRARAGGLCPICLNAMRLVDATGELQSLPLIPPR